MAVERFFAAPIPYRSVDADTMLERFRVVTASVSFEGDVPSFFQWLSGGGIPLEPEAREAGGFPVVGAGGALTYINPLILSAVCDFIVLGDGMDALPGLVAALRSYEAHGDRRRLWRELAEDPCVLVPPLHITDGCLSARRRVGRSLPLDGQYPMCSAWTSPKSAFGDTLLVELQRGCMRNCRYCTLPGCFGKIRFRRFGFLKNTMDTALDATGAAQVGLVTPEAGDYVDMEPLLDYLDARNEAVSFASLRVDHLTERMMATLTRGGRHSLTIAPEAGRDELRFACGKKFTNELILEKLALARGHGIDQVKLYFMIGLPGETEEDIAAIMALCSRIIAETGQNLILSVNPFVPKPGTPWAREDFCGIPAIRAKYARLSADVRAIRKKAPQLRLTSPKEAQAEFDAAWYSFDESRALAVLIESGKKAKICYSDRDKTLRELLKLEYLGPEEKAQQ